MTGVGAEAGGVALGELAAALGAEAVDASAAGIRRLALLGWRQVEALASRAEALRRHVAADGGAVDEAFDGLEASVGAARRRREALAARGAASLSDPDAALEGLREAVAARAGIAAALGAVEARAIAPH